MAFRRLTPIWFVALACGLLQCGGGDDNGGGGETQTTEIPAEVGVPEDLMASIQTNPLRVLLSWDYTGAEPVSFAVYRANEAGDLAVGNLTATLLLDETDELFYTDNDVDEGTTYYYRVRAFQGTTFGPASQVVAVTLSKDGGGGTVIIVQPPQPGPGPTPGPGPGPQPAPDYNYVIIPDRSAGGLVDDDLTVKLNGTPIYVDNDTVPSPIPDIKFVGSPGDLLRIEARDEGGACGFMAAMTVKRICDNATAAQISAAARDCPAPGEPTGPTEVTAPTDLAPATFFAQTYTLARQPAGPGCD